MDQGLLTAAVTALIGPAGLIAAVIAWRARKREEPVRQRDADIAVAHTLQGMGVSIAEGLRTDITRMQADIAALQDEVGKAKDEARAAREEAGAARSQLREAWESETVVRRENSILWAWISDIIDHWGTRRRSERPPTAPTVNREGRA